MKKYVDITSGTAGVSAAARRNMGARVFTTSEKVGFGHVKEFTSADQVMSYFGSDSDEYKFAVKYFGFISKSVTKATKISFARYNNSTSVQDGYVIASVPVGDVVNTLHSVNIGCLRIKIGSAIHELGGLDFTKKEIEEPVVATSEVEPPEGVPQVHPEVDDQTFLNKVFGVGTRPTELGNWTVTFECTDDGSTSGSVEWTVTNYDGTTVENADIADWGVTLDGDPWVAGGEGEEATLVKVVYTREMSDEYAVKSISDVCAVITAAIDSASDEWWKSNCSVTYSDTASNGVRFNFENLADPVTAFIEINPGDKYEVASILKVTDQFSPILSDCVSKSGPDGAIGFTPVEYLSASVAQNDDFGSFMFLGWRTAGSMTTITDDQVAEIAQLNASWNTRYLYSVATNAARYSQLDGKLGSVKDVVVTYYDDVQGYGYEEFAPMVLFAATNYERPNSTKCNMYQQFDTLNTSVDSDELSNKLDTMRINYYGCTQKAGKQISFYQRGYNHDGTDTACFCNEVWMKDAIETEVLNLFLAKEKIPGNDAGRALVQIIIKGVVDEAIYNGTVMPSATLDNIQKSTVKDLSNDDDAPDAVETNGYWLGVKVQHKTDEFSNVLYYADYVLLYKKGDAIRKVTGSDILI